MLRSNSTNAAIYCSGFYVASAPGFDTLEQVSEVFRATGAAFGTLTLMTVQYKIKACIFATPQASRAPCCGFILLANMFSGQVQGVVSDITDDGTTCT